MKTPKLPAVYASVPADWQGETAVLLATGPSLCADDVDYCRGKARVLAIKDAVRLAPWADALYACDGKWWEHYGDRLAFDAPRYSLDAKASRWAQILKNTGFTGLESSPDGLKTGKNSGYQAIGLAVHLGATRLILLGYDMGPLKHTNHFHGEHPWRSVPPFVAFIPLFSSLLEPLRQRGVTVINASRRTELACFPRQALREALP